MPLLDPPLPADLRPFVESCVGYDEATDPAAVHHGLPSPAATLILAFDEPLDSGWLAERTTDRHWTVLSGLHVAPALIRTHGHLHGVQLGLTPRGARALTGAPLGAVAGVITDAGPLVPGLADLHDRLAATPDWPTRFDRLVRFLRAHVASASDLAPPAAEVAEAWRRLAHRGGRVRVEALAAELGWSRRRLSGRFADEVGLTPKQSARVFRFTRAQALARRHPLAEVADLAGYADQAHLCREWQALAGRTPTASLAGDYYVA
jgi:AraC-like DNA-binding protein